MLSGPKIVVFILVSALGGCALPRGSSEESGGSRESAADDGSSPPKGADALVERAASDLVPRARAWVDDRKCVLSCHTTVPFLLVASHLGGEADELRTTVLRRIGARVEDWDRVDAWYSGSEQKIRESRATESVLNAHALAHASRVGAAVDGTPIEMAITLMLAERSPRGDWPWLDFSLHPWESNAAHRYGQILATSALAWLPATRRAGIPGAELAFEQLTETLVESVASEALYEQLLIARLAADVPNLLDRSMLESIARSCVTVQGSDGGWTTAALGDWSRRDGTDNDPDGPSDGHATGLVVSVLGDHGLEPEAHARGLQWLLEHARDDGTWPGRSLNDDDAFNHRLFTDAATAMAVHALATRERRRGF